MNFLYCCIYQLWYGKVRYITVKGSEYCPEAMHISMSIVEARVHNNRGGVLGEGRVHNIRGYIMNS